MPRPTVKSHREGGGESVQSMTATRDTHESMHALVDKVPIAILVADQSGSWPTVAFLDGRRGQVPALVPSPWSRLRWQHNEEEGALPASKRAQMNAHLPRLVLLPPFVPPLITVVVVLRGSFSGIRQQRTGIADGRASDHCRRTDDAAAAPSESQIRPQREGGQRKLQGKEGLRDCDCPAPPPQSAFALRRAANVQKRKSERRLPIYLFYIVFLQWPYRIAGGFQGR